MMIRDQRELTNHLKVHLSQILQVIFGFFAQPC